MSPSIREDRDIKIQVRMYHIIPTTGIPARSEQGCVRPRYAGDFRLPEKISDTLRAPVSAPVHGILWFGLRLSRSFGVALERLVAWPCSL